jgi:hypothetical protein
MGLAGGCLDGYDDLGNISKLKNYGGVDGLSGTGLAFFRRRAVPQSVNLRRHDICHSFCEQINE